MDSAATKSRGFQIPRCASINRTRCPSTSKSASSALDTASAPSPVRRSNHSMAASRTRASKSPAPVTTEILARQTPGAGTSPAAHPGRSRRLS